MSDSAVTETRETSTQESAEPTAVIDNLEGQCGKMQAEV